MRNISVRVKILAVLIALTVFFGLSMVIFAKTVIHDKLQAKLQEKGIVIAARTAAECIDRAITGKYFEIELMLKDLKRTEHDLVYAFVLNEDNRVLAHTFSGGVPAELAVANVVNPLSRYSIKALATDKGKVLDIGIPLLRGQVGVLRMGISGDSVEADVNAIVMLIILFALFVFITGSAAAAGFSRAITKPLQELAAAADAFGRGEMNRQVVINSNDEIGELARIFNQMVDRRTRLADERESLILELRQALKDVKTLGELLPVCASCKKVRDDKGYWNQIDAYISEHSDTRISHGLCPDCSKRLYPEYTLGAAKSGETG